MKTPENNNSSPNVSDFNDLTLNGELDMQVNHKLRASRNPFTMRSLPHSNFSRAEMNDLLCRKTTQ